MFTMPVGTRLELKLWLNDEQVQAAAIVATRSPQVGNGIEFIDMAPEDRLKLARFINQPPQAGK